MSDDENGNRRGSGQRQLSGRERFARGLAGYHDPLAGFGGAPPALSALTLRLVLAIFGLVPTRLLLTLHVLHDGHPLQGTSP
jgi:hypothetical protein